MCSLEQLLSDLAVAQDNARRDAELLRARRTEEMALDDELDDLEQQKQFLLQERIPGLSEDARHWHEKRHELEVRVNGRELLAERLFDAVNARADKILLSADDDDDFDHNNKNSSSKNTFFLCFSAARGNPNQMCGLHRALLVSPTNNNNNSVVTQDGQDQDGQQQQNFIKSLSEFRPEAGAALWQTVRTKLQEVVAEAAAALRQQEIEDAMRDAHSVGGYRPTAAADSSARHQHYKHQQHHDAAPPPPAPVTRTRFRPQQHTNKQPPPPVNRGSNIATATMTTENHLEYVEPLTKQIEQHQQQQQQHKQPPPPLPTKKAPPAPATKKKVSFAANNNNNNSTDAAAPPATVAPPPPPPKPATSNNNKKQKHEPPKKSVVFEDDEDAFDSSWA